MGIGWRARPRQRGCDGNRRAQPGWPPPAAAPLPEDRSPPLLSAPHLNSNDPCSPRLQECTTFHFDVKPDSLRPALDRFAQVRVCVGWGWGWGWGWGCRFGWGEPRVEASLRVPTQGAVRMYCKPVPSSPPCPPPPPPPQFFRAPLVKSDALDREVQAVDNEFSGVLQVRALRSGPRVAHLVLAGHRCCCPA